MIKLKRTFRAAFIAFFMTVCISLTVGAFAVVDRTVGQRLFGSAYASAVLHSTVPSRSTEPLLLPLPAHMQVLLELPYFGADCVGWLLSR